MAEKKKCDWCGKDLLKMRKGVLVSFPETASSNNLICDACWREHRLAKAAQQALGRVVTAAEGPNRGRPT